MKRLLVSTAFMFLIVCCETENTNQIKLAAFGSSSKTMITNPDEKHEKDSTDKILVAIIHFHNRTGDPALGWLENGISDMFEKQLGKTVELRILNMQNLLKTAEKLNFEHADLFRSFAAIQTAKEAKADLLLSGNFYQENDSLCIDIMLKNIHTGKDLCHETVRGRGMDQLMAMVDTISEHILTKIPKKL